jgi:hypothetical protein
MAENRNRPSEKESLERREYKDKQGNVHHHTKTYMHQHHEGESKRDPQHHQGEAKRDDKSGGSKRGDR